jgi:ParB family chromosome partitioning protein
VFREIPLEAVAPNPRQPRSSFDDDSLAELAASLREVGLLQPVIVRELPGPAPTGVEGPAYELVMGERRWRAARLAGLTTVPAIVRETPDTDLLRDALLENLHREQLNPLEEAAAYGQLLEDFGVTHEALAQQVGKSRSHVSNTLRLLGLPPTVQRRVAAGVLSAGHARALLGLDSSAEQERLAGRIVAEGLSVRAVEEIVAVGEAARKKPRNRTPRAVAPGLEDLGGRLSEHFETRVRVDLGRAKGKIVVEFASLDDLERIVAAMAPGLTSAPAAPEG